MADDGIVGRLLDAENNFSEWTLVRKDSKKHHNSLCVCRGLERGCVSVRRDGLVTFERPGCYFAGDSVASMTPGSPWSGEISTKVGVDKRLEKHVVKGAFTTPKHVHGG